MSYKKVQPKGKQKSTHSTSNQFGHIVKLLSTHTIQVVLNKLSKKRVVPNFVRQCERHNGQVRNISHTD
jgi:hypothetical protein